MNCIFCGGGEISLSLIDYEVFRCKKCNRIFDLFDYEEYQEKNLQEA